MVGFRVDCHICTIHRRMLWRNKEKKNVIISSNTIIQCERKHTCTPMNQSSSSSCTHVSPFTREHVYAYTRKCAHVPTPHGVTGTRALAHKCTYDSTLLYTDVADQDHLYSAWCTHALHKASIGRKRIWRTVHAFAQCSCYNYRFGKVR